MDGVFRTVPYPYIRDCVVRALEPHLSNADELTLEQTARIGSSDRFVNDSESFLELVAYALDDPGKPLETLRQHAAEPAFLDRYLEARRNTQGPRTDFNKVIGRFQKLRHGPNGQKTMHPIPAAVDGLRRLLEKDWPVCIVSNSPHESVRSWFSKHKIPLQHVVGSDDVSVQKPNPECLWTACKRLNVPADRHVLYAGDLPNDVMAARTAGLTPIGIAYGDHVKRLQAAKPDRLFDDFGKLADYLS